MPKRDISGRVVDKVAQLSRSTADKLRDFIPYGPSRVQLTPAELRSALDRMTQQQYQELISRIGVDEATRVLMAVQPKLPGPRSLSEFMQDNPVEENNAGTK